MYQQFWQFAETLVRFRQQEKQQIEEKLHLERLRPQQTRLIHGERFSGLLSTFILRMIGEDTRQGFIQMNSALKAWAEALVPAT